MNWPIVTDKITPDIVLDIGANRGWFFMEAKTHWPNAYYLLVEASDECQPHLEELGVDYSIAVLSDVPDKVVTFYTLKDNPCATGNSVYKEITSYYEGEQAVPNKLRTRTLDEVCSHIDFTDKKVLLKLDVQGSEIDVLKGGKVVLEQCDGIIVEVSHVEYNKGAPTEKEVRSYLVDRGFDEVGVVNTIVHPITRDEIQNDIFWLKRA